MPRVIFAVVLLLAVTALAANQAVEFGGGKGDGACFAYDDTTHILQVCTIQTMTPTATPTNTPTPTPTPTRTPTPTP